MTFEANAQTRQFGAKREYHPGGLRIRSEALRKWWIFFVAGAVVVGCAGGDGGTASGTTGSGATTGTTSGGPVRVVPTVNLPTQDAQVQIEFLTGLGRRSPGSQYAKLSLIRLKNGVLDQIPTAFSGSTDYVNLQLDGFTTNTFLFSQSFTGATKPYSTFSAVVTDFKEEDLDGNLNTVFNGSFALPDLPVTVNLAHGRTSSFLFYINNGSLFYSGGILRFDQDAWNADNLVNGETSIPSHFSDAIAIDISGMATANRPTMKSSNPADRILLTGDSIGLAQGNTVNGSFDLYGPAYIESGSLTLPVTNLMNGDAPGSYSVLEPNPDPFVVDPAFLPALQGTWRDLNAAVTNGGNQVFLIIPGNSTTTAQAVLIKRNGTTVSDVYVGRATVSSTGGTFELWSCDQIDNNTENNKITGTFSNVTATSTRINDGDYTITSGSSPFASTGVFVVYN